MFLENDYARPLFDFEQGGVAKAFECKDTNCKKVTRTERGMRMHLKAVHNWKEQPCLYSTDAPTKEKSGTPRKLRLFTKENIAATIKRSSIPATEPDHAPPTTPPQPIAPETKDEPLLKLTSEEK